MFPRPFVIICETAESRKYRIRPGDFNLESRDAIGFTFAKSKVEITVRRLISFFQCRGYWCSFTIDELRQFYELKGWNYNSMFFGLMGAWYDDNPDFGWTKPNEEVFLGTDSEGKYVITDRFIDRCSRNLKSRAA